MCVCVCVCVCLHVWNSIRDKRIERKGEKRGDK